MEQHKNTLVFDHFIEVGRKNLYKVTKWLNVGSVAYAVEPWPDDRWRVYVRKDAAETLNIMEEELHWKGE
jgi:hypothetical protein